MKIQLLTLMTCLLAIASHAQSFKFALVTDTHVGGSTGAADLRRTVQDLNHLEGIDFVILSGDVTEFGSDEELRLAKQILDSLHLPLHILPGNHDSNWSESGANSFRKIFGAESFFFQHKGFLFLGNASGPNVRMSPGQVPREHVVYMDSIFAAHPDLGTPVIFINHYPLDASLNNWFEVIDRLKQRNTQLALCGHGHANKLYDWEGIPGVMNRSNLRAKEEFGGYNIISIDNGKATFQERKPLSMTNEAWLQVELKNHHFLEENKNYPRPVDSLKTRINKYFTVQWDYQDQSDVIAGISHGNKTYYTSNTAGKVYALNGKSGKLIWKFQTNGKVYSTPAIHDKRLIVGSTDGNIYALNSNNGKELWRFATSKAVLGSPVIDGELAYIGGSDGVFRALNIFSGQEVWSFNSVKGHVTTRPTIYGQMVLFGSWQNGFYALEKSSGKLLWEWDNGHNNRMFSPAACYPVAINGRIFIVAPDRYMTCLEASSGNVIWREKMDEHRVRESMGLSADGKYVYVKTMDGQLLGICVFADTMEVAWKSDLQLGYEISPTAIVANKKWVFVPSNNGLLSAVDAKTGKLAWQYKISNSMINPVQIIDNQLVFSSLDGKIIQLKIN